jgi:VanZ family protein
MNGSYPEKNCMVCRFVALLALCSLIVLSSCASGAAFSGFSRSVLRFLSLEQNPSAVYLMGHPDLRHVIAYGLLTLLLYFTLKTRYFLLPPALAFSFGLFMEAAQRLVPSRECSWSDLGCNLLGIGGALVVWVVVSGVRGAMQKRRNREGSKLLISAADKNG